MATEGEVEIQIGKAQGDQERSSGGSTGPRSTGVSQVDQGAVEWLFTALAQHGEDIDVPAHSDNSDRDITGPEAEAFDLPEGEPLSVETLFGYDIERDYVGDPKVNDDEKLSEVEGTDAVDRHVTVDLGHSINGYYSDMIDEQFGEDVHISVGMGATNLYDNPYDRAQNVRFKTTQSGDKSGRRKRRSMWNASEVDFDQEDYEQWCEDNDIEPYPRRNGNSSSDEGDDEGDE